MFILQYPLLCLCSIAVAFLQMGTCRNAKGRWFAQGHENLSSMPFTGALLALVLAVLWSE